MRATPPPHVRHPTKPLTGSLFIRRMIEQIDLAPGSSVLDIPTGSGRHALLFAERGHKLTVADIDAGLAQEAAKLCGGIGVTLDATAPLPFPPASFDAVVIVDFVHEGLLQQMGDALRSGGLLMYESYSARGGNWQQLLLPGATKAILEPEFEFIEYKSRPAGPTRCEAEVIRLLGRRR